MKNAKLLPLVFLMFPALLSAQDAQSILKEMQEKQQERMEGIDNYTITISMQEAMGMEVPVYQERIELEGVTTFRQIPQPIYERDMQIEAGFPPPEETSAQMAEALKMAAPHMNQGGPADAFQLDWDQMIAFAEAGAVAYDSISDGTEEAAADVRSKRLFLERAKLIGVEQVEATSSGSPQTREAYHIKADGLDEIDLGQVTESGEYRMSSASWWIDKEHYVPLAFKMEGEMEQKGKITPLTIQGKHLDYTKVKSLYEPFTKIYQLGGIMQAMSEKDQKEMEKARAEMAKAKEEMAKMTPEQQAMMKRMMGDRFEEMEKMLEGGDFETRIKVVSIAINEGPPAVYGLGSVDNQPALTIAMEDVSADGALAGQIEISVGPFAERGELKLLLVGNAPFPMPGETMQISSASGHLQHNKSSIEVTGATGNITVDYRSETHIRGTYSVDLVFAGGVLPTINGEFRSPPPLGPGQAPMGSPIPAGLFSGQD